MLVYRGGNENDNLILRGIVTTLNTKDNHKYFFKQTKKLISHFKIYYKLFY